MAFILARALMDKEGSSPNLGALKTICRLRVKSGHSPRVWFSFLEWTTGKADESDIAAAIKGFPERVAAFQFNWPNGDANVSVNVDDTSIITGTIIHSQAGL